MNLNEAMNLFDILNTFETLLLAFFNFPLIQVFEYNKHEPEV